jgi:hypothetical protein
MRRETDIHIRPDDIHRYRLLYCKPGQAVWVVSVVTVGMVGKSTMRAEGEGAQADGQAGNSPEMCQFLLGWEIVVQGSAASVGRDSVCR